MEHNIAVLPMVEEQKTEDPLFLVDRRKTNGDRRSLVDQRRFSYTAYSPERRVKKGDRRQGVKDRRKKSLID